MALKKFFLYIWNGGLDPAVAAPGLLRQRRTLSTTSMLLIPVAIILIIANFTVYDAARENVEVGAVLLLGLLGLGLQAYKGWDRFAALLLVASIWFASTSIILRHGFDSANWVWMTSAVLIAILVTSRGVAVAYTSIVIITLLVFAVMTDYGYLKSGLNLQAHALSVAISGSLNFVIMCVVGFAFNTNQIATEQVLSTNVQRLDQEVATRRQAEKEALAGKRAKNTFLTTISHELRTPLNGVIGAGQLLSDSALSPEQQELVQVVRSSGEDLLELINNVLDLARLEAGKLQLESKAFSLPVAIESAMAPLVEQGRKKNVMVSYEIDPELSEYVSGDEIRLKQIIKNLCGNALKFTESGQVELIAGNLQGKLQLTVTDTGIGIAEEARKDLFLPFTQADLSGDLLPGGTGLGLTIVAELVRLQNGAIDLYSEVGKGSVFTITLPMAPCQPMPDEKYSNEESAEQSTA